jgi:hypothetical protein
MPRTRLQESEFLFPAFQQLVKSCPEPIEQQFVVKAPFLF